jgi:hypothetical protein
MTGEKIGGLASDIFALVLMISLLVITKRKKETTERKFMGLPYLKVLYAGIIIFMIMIIVDLVR